MFWKIESFTFWWRVRFKIYTTHICMLNIRLQAAAVILA